MVNGKLLKKYPGFTLIELLITFAVIGVLAAVSTVSFITYNQSQSLSSGSKDIEQMLALAKSRAQSQVKPADCVGPLIGYAFRTCGGGTPCETTGDYEVVAVCKDANGATTFVLSSSASNAPAKKLPSGAMLAPSSKGKTIEFQVLTGGVVGETDIVLLGTGGAKKIISIDNQGNIDEKDE